MHKTIIIKLKVKNAHDYHNKVKDFFNMKTKDDHFHTGNLVLRWDVRNEDKSKNANFENLWFGIIRVERALNNNTSIL